MQFTQRMYSQPEHWYSAAQSYLPPPEAITAAQLAHWYPPAHNYIPPPPEGVSAVEPAHWLLQRYFHLGEQATSFLGTHQGAPDPWQGAREAAYTSYVASRLRASSPAQYHVPHDVTPLHPPHYDAALLPGSLQSLWHPSLPSQDPAPSSSESSCSGNPGALPGRDTSTSLEHQSHTTPLTQVPPGHQTSGWSPRAASASSYSSSGTPGTPQGTSLQHPSPVPTVVYPPTTSPKTTSSSDIPPSKGTARGTSALSTFLATFADHPPASTKRHGGKSTPLKSCPYCPKTFVKNRALRYHLAARHPSADTAELTSTITCLVCAKTFACPSTLRTHMRAHTGERPYACAECGEAFSDRSVWRRHQRVHTGYRPYVCSVCGLDFSQSGNLKRHMNTQHSNHNNETMT